MSDQSSTDEIRPIHEITSHYVDSATSRFSPYTFALVLGVTDPSDSEDETIPLVQLLMSPHHAKALAAHMMTSIAAYEEAYGTINVPGLTSKFTLSVRDASDGAEEAKNE